MPAHERHSQIFANEDRANVFAIGLERPAASSVVAVRRSFSARLARTGDELEIELARMYEVANPARGLVTQLALRCAHGAAGFRRVEADQPDVRLLVIDADSIAVDHAYVVGCDRAGLRGC